MFDAFLKAYFYFLLIIHFECTKVLRGFQTNYLTANVQPPSAPEAGVKFLVRREDTFLLHLFKFLLRLGFNYFREDFGNRSRSVGPLMGIFQ